MIYLIDLNVIDAELEALLSKELQDKNEYKRYHHRKDQMAHLCSAIIPKALGISLGYYTTKEDISRGQYGKPYIASSMYEFNVSHSGNYMVVTYNTKPIGIDIEETIKYDDDVIKNCFSEEEGNYVSFAAEEEKNNRFTDIWTAKESYFKYMGYGIGDTMSSISVIASPVKEMIITERFVADRLYSLSVCCKNISAFIDERNRLRIKALSYKEIATFFELAERIDKDDCIMIKKRVLNMLRNI